MPARYALPGRSDCTCPRLVATMHHGRHMGGSILTGLGVRIDYSLFILTRTRTGLRRGLSVEEAVTAAAGAAGRDVQVPARPAAVQRHRLGEDPNRGMEAYDRRGTGRGTRCRGTRG